MRNNSSSNRQRGVVLLYTLIALVIMLISAVALVRSFNTSLFNAGNMAFKRDLFNQGERARQSAFASLNGPLAAAVDSLYKHAPAEHYSATMLQSNAQGIPLALLNDTYSY